MQLIQSHQSSKDSLLRTFINGLLFHYSDEEVEELLPRIISSPIKASQELLESSPRNVLWAALESAFVNSPGLFEYSNSVPGNAGCVTFIFELADLGREDVHAFMSVFHRMITALHGSFRGPRARMVVTCETKLVELDLQKLSTVVIEYDKERQGMYR